MILFFFGQNIFINAWALIRYFTVISFYICERCCHRVLYLQCSQDYEEVNSVIVTKIQFYAIELARNREGFNDQIRHNFKPKKRKAKAGPTQEEQFHSNLTKEVQHELQSILGGNHPLMK